MKKCFRFINLLLLIINIALLICFSVYTILGSNPAGSYITGEILDFQLIIALLYEFFFFAVSLIISKVQKKDLSYKGTDFLRHVPKIISIFTVLLSIGFIAYTVIFKIGIEFVVTVIVMLFSIVIEIGITKLFFITKY